MSEIDTGEAAAVFTHRDLESTDLVELLGQLAAAPLDRVSYPLFDLHVLQVHDHGHYSYLP